VNAFLRARRIREHQEPAARVVAWQAHRQATRSDQLVISLIWICGAISV
jgi:hypothetical protein